MSIPFPLHPVFEGGTLLADPFRCKTDTPILKSKGDTVNLRSIRDGRDKDAVAKREVILSNFLEREPGELRFTPEPSAKSSNTLAQSKN